MRLLNDCGFDDICISVKCSDVRTNMAAYRMLRAQTDYPLHLGVTEAGTPRMGVLKSAIGIGGLLCLGVGDTLRVSLTADPVEEVVAAKQILAAAGIRRSGPNLISCPTCGRTRYDMIPIAEEVERRLQNCDKPITVAVMGASSTALARRPRRTSASREDRARALSFAKAKYFTKYRRIGLWTH